MHDRQWEALVAALSEPAPMPQWADDLVALAFQLLHAGRLDDAEAMSSLAVDHQGGVPAWRARAIVRLVALRLDEAMADLDAWLAAVPDDPDALGLRGGVQQLRGRYPDMVDDYTRLLRLDPDRIDAWLARGYGLLRLARPEAAVLDFDAALERDASRTLAHVLRGLSQFGLRRFEAAESDFGVAIERRFDFIDWASASFQALNAGGADRMLVVLNHSAALLGGRVGGGADAGHSGQRAGPDPYLVGMRALSRLQLRRWADAEADLDVALASGFGDACATLLESMRAATLPGLRAPAAADAASRLDNDVLHFLRGMARLEQGRAADALGDLQHAVATGAGGVDANAALASALTLLGRGGEALPWFDAFFDAGRDDLRTRSLRAAAHVDRGEFEPALRDLDATLALGRDDPWVHQRRGECLIRLGRLDEAAAAADRAITHQPEAGEPYLLRAAARFDQGRLDECEADLDRVFALGLQAPGALALRGLLRWRQDRHAESEADLRAAQALGVRDINTLYVLACLELARADHEAAEADCNAAIELGRDDAYVHYVRGRARYGLDREAEAEADFDLAFERGMPERAELHLWRGRARLWQGRHADALADLDQSIEAGGGGGLLHYLRGLCLARLERFEAACEALDAAEREGRQDAVLHALRAEVNRQLQRPEAARRDADAALALDAGHAGALRISVLIALDGARFDDAIAHGDAALEQGPPTGELHIARGVARFMTGRLQPARDDFTRGHELDPTDPWPLAWRARAALREGDLRAAADDLEAARALLPGSAEICRQDGLLALARGAIDDARRAFESVAAPELRAWSAFTHWLSGAGGETLEAWRGCLSGADPGERALFRSEAAHWAARLALPAPAPRRDPDLEGCLDLLFDAPAPEAARP